MTEHDEAVLFAEWCNRYKIDCWHIQQEMWTPSWKQKNIQKLEGVRKGISDYIVIIPKKRCKLNKAIILFIELKKPMKRLMRKSLNGKKGDLVPCSNSKPTKEQLRFLALVSEVSNVEGYIAYGGNSAIDKVKRYI